MQSLGLVFAVIFLIAFTAKVIGVVGNRFFKPAPNHHEICRSCSELVILYLGHGPSCC